MDILALSCWTCLRLVCHFQMTIKTGRKKKLCDWLSRGHSSEDSGTSVPFMRPAQTPPHLNLQALTRANHTPCPRLFKTKRCKIRYACPKASNLHCARASLGQIPLTLRHQTHENKQQSPSRRRPHLSPVSFGDPLHFFGGELCRFNRREGEITRSGMKPCVCPPVPSASLCRCAPSWSDPNLTWVVPPLWAHGSPPAPPYGLHAGRG